MTYLFTNGRLRIHQLMAPKEKTRKKIGFEIKEPKTKYRKKRKKN
jgi:hypothetical protein